jgi:hypothetical protein
MDVSGFFVGKILIVYPQKLSNARENGVVIRNTNAFIRKENGVLIRKLEKY